MKKTVSLLLAVLLVLSLCACGKTEKNVDPAALAAELTKSSAFSATLNELPASKADVFYELDESMIGDAVMFHASGTNQEQIAIFTATDEKAASAIEAQLKSLIEQWTKTEADYAPAEVTKLQNAILRRSGKTVILVVAADAKAAEKIIG